MTIINKLVKFLQLEVERGYDNRAVFGGLESMLEPWEAEAIEAEIPAKIVEIVVSRLRDYPKLTIHSRKETLHGLLNRLREEFPSQEDEPKVQAPDLKASEIVKMDPPSAPRAEPQQGAQNGHTQDEAASPEIVKKSSGAAPVEIAAKQTRVALSAALTTFPGVGPKTAKTLTKLGLETLEDLLWHLPRRYDDYSRLKPINRLWYGEEVTIIGTVESMQVRSVRSGRMKLVEGVVGDGTGTMRVTWFNQPWIADKLKPGRGVVLSGKVDQYLGHLSM
ncbi:MAG: hypothetical protein IIC78_12300, partial [Chloroflexi bacterium]|nr:hypothetical protein [Chloroflexota bacterium]